MTEIRTAVAIDPNQPDVPPVPAGPRRSPLSPRSPLFSPLPPSVPCHGKLTLFVKTHFRKTSWESDLSRGKKEVGKPAKRSLTHARCARCSTRPRRAVPPHAPIAPSSPSSAPSSRGRFLRSYASAISKSILPRCGAQSLVNSSLPITLRHLSLKALRGVPQAQRGLAHAQRALRGVPAALRGLPRRCSAASCGPPQPPAWL